MNLIGPDENWRESLLNMLLLVFGIVSLPVLINETLYRDDWLVPLLAWSVVPALFFSRPYISMPVRAGLLVVILMLVGSWGSYSGGLMGAGRVFMGSAVILSALLLGRVSGIVLFLASTVALSAIGAAAVYGLLTFAAPFDITPNTSGLWISHVGSFVIAVGVLLMSVLFVIETLERLHLDLRSEMEERELLEAEERKNAQHMKFMAENISDVLWTADLDLNFTYISDSITRARGFTPEEAMREGVAGALAVDSPDIVHALLEEELAREGTADPNRTTRLETRLNTKDGTGLDVEINVSFLRDRQGKPIGLIGVTRDLTERKRFEFAMDSVIRGTRQTREGDFFDSLTLNLATVLQAHTVMIGTLSEQSSLDCISIYQRSRHVDRYRYPLAGSACNQVIAGGLFCVESGAKDQFPDDVYLSEHDIEGFVGTPLLDTTGKVIGILLCATDRPLEDARLTQDLLTVFAAHASLALSRQRAESEREAIQLQLQQAQKLESVGRLTGGIAHDFNNLLVVIQGFAELAMDQADNNAALKDSLKNIQEGTDRAAALTRQLLSFSRRQVIDTRPTDLDELLPNLSAMLSRLLPETIDYELRLSKEVNTIEADPGQIEQAIINLAVNARDAMPQGGTLRIETRQVDLDNNFVSTHPGSQIGRHVRLRISDTGEGMSEDIVERVFEPFFTTKPDGMGTGLGLSVVFGIVKQHSGFIDVQSQQDKGTRIDLYFPVLSQPAEVHRSAPRADAEGNSRGSETILLVEDEPAVRKLASTFLTRAGYKVIEAVDGEDAVDQFSAHSDEISLALLDVVLPKANGREVMDKIKTVSPELKVLFTSGYSSDGIHTNFILEDELILLQKPYRRDELLEKIREVLDA